MRETYFQKPDITGEQDLSEGPLAFTTSIGRKFRLTEIHIHFDGATTETITVTKVSAKGANYNTVLRKVSIVAATDFVFEPKTIHKDFQAGDEVKLQISDDLGTNTAYYTIKSAECN